MEERVTVDDPTQLKKGEGIQIGDTKYDYAADLQTEGATLVDTQQGKQFSIRLFQFKMNPELKGEIDKQQLFNAHAKQIKTILWGDGLSPMLDISPRVIIDNKKGEYQIFVPCEPRISTSFAEKARNLSQSLHNK